MTHHFILPDWPAPASIQALCTTRLGGWSQAPFDSLNFGDHVQDHDDHVHRNRAWLRDHYSWKREPFWLKQTHSNQCLIAEASTHNHADAAITRQPGQPLVVMTADCLPILIAHRHGQEIAAIHAGWRGLVNGVISATIQKLHHPCSEYLAWIGPGICQQCFEVGDDVYEALLQDDPAHESFLTPHADRWLLDAQAVAQHTLHKLGLVAVYRSTLCTFEKKDWFFSYRREGQTGRMATLIWMESNHDQNND
jgi:YfiH family protein